MLETYQYQSPVVGYQAPAPVVGQAVAPAQTGLDMSSLLSTIFPIITLMLVMGLIMPMFRQMGSAFETR